jgi:hypothetical protein
MISTTKRYSPSELSSIAGLNVALQRSLRKRFQDGGMRDVFYWGLGEVTNGRHTFSAADVLTYAIFMIYRDLGHDVHKAAMMAFYSSRHVAHQLRWPVADPSSRDLGDFAWPDTARYENCDFESARYVLFATDTANPVYSARGESIQITSATYTAVNLERLAEALPENVLRWARGLAG